MRMFFLFKQKTAYEMRISDWSSDVCSSDLGLAVLLEALPVDQRHRHLGAVACGGPGALGGVLRRVVAQHRLLLELAALPGFDVELVGRFRRGHRGVAVA